MNLLRTGTIAALICAPALYAASIFSDEMTASSSNWAKLTGSAAMVASASGSLVDNSAGTGPTLFLHTLDAAPVVFNYAMTFSGQNATGGYGLVFGWQSLSSSGYLFSVHNGWYDLSRYTNGTPAVVAEGPTSFVGSYGAMELSIARRSGNILELGCNGSLIASLTDNATISGDVGIYIGAGQSVRCSAASVTDAGSAIAPRSAFFDSFDNALTDNWMPLQSGSEAVSESDGTMSIDASAGQQTAISSGTFAATPCTLVVTRTAGPTSRFYGLTLLDISTARSGNQINYVTSGRNYFISGDHLSAVFAPSTAGTGVLNTNITGLTDTLVVTADGSFYVNGHLIDGTKFTSASTEPWNSFGIFADSGLVLSVESVAVGDYQNTPIVEQPKQNPTKSIRTSWQIGGVGIVVDARGRTVAKVTGDVRSSMKDLPQGVYCIIENAGAAGEVRKAVIHSK